MAPKQTAPNDEYTRKQKKSRRMAFLNAILFEFENSSMALSFQDAERKMQF
jgi:hypothetical protein